MSLSISYARDRSARTIHGLLGAAGAAGHRVLFLGDESARLDVSETGLRRMDSVLNDRGAAIVYSDSLEQPHIDYQIGSVRDDFEFGPLVALSVPCALSALENHGPLDPGLEWGGLYDLRLKLSLDAEIVRIPESLYSASGPESRSTDERLFDYVDRRKRDYQTEMERVFTSHLKRLGAYLPPRQGRVESDLSLSDIKASIVIPVRNRRETIAEAVDSALSQTAAFPFNVIVVNNRSTDGTDRVLRSFQDSRLVVKVPDREDLEIGGCWQLAIESAECGRYALQLDSDDLFVDPDVLERVVGELESERLAMLVGSYTTVNFDLDPIAPGLVDHSEWTPENGHNNVLRVNGFGAPRAFDVSLVRDIGFPNVSYGEDYAVGLRVARDYAIGRIYDSLYLCRRWEGNTDGAPSVEQMNRFNVYKDWLRSTEIHARIQQNRQSE